MFTNWDKKEKAQACILPRPWWWENEGKAKY